MCSAARRRVLRDALRRPARAAGRRGGGLSGAPPVSPGTGRLLLGREDGQAVLVGKDVRVTVVGRRGRQTVLEIRAPRDVPVRREELAPPRSRPETGA